MPLERLIDNLDWSSSPLGPRATWSISLRTVLDTLLRAQAEIVLFWGPEFVALYNDAYAPTIGDKHPRALGRPACEYWSELWDDLEPLLRGVRETGETFASKDRPFYIERHGYGETVYFDVSYSAVPDDDGSVGGVLCIVSETTERILAKRRVTESERRLRALVEATSDMIYAVSADWSRMTLLEGKDLLPDVEAPGVIGPLQFIPPEDHALVEQAVLRATARRSVFECEHRVYLKNGEIGWVHSRAVPILDENGNLLEWFGTASEITAARQQREHLEVVVHELDHRVKNTLAMVLAIARQTFRDDAELSEAQIVFERRIKAIADANALLTGDRIIGASLTQAIERAVKAYAPDEARLDLKGPDVVLTPRMALSISLAMHELATNAVKYGAWSGDRGKVEVRWGKRHDGQHTLLMIEWQERDGPPVAPPTRRGFGSRLIERGLSAELNGDARLHFDPDGLHCAMQARLPLAEGEAR